MSIARRLQISIFFILQFELQLHCFIVSGFMIPFHSVVVLCAHIIRFGLAMSFLILHCQIAAESNKEIGNIESTLGIVYFSNYVSLFALLVGISVEVDFDLSLACWNATPLHCLCNFFAFFGFN